MQSWNLDTTWVLIKALCELSLGAPGYVIEILLAKNRLKVHEFELIYLGKYRYWWKMVDNFEHAIYHILVLIEKAPILIFCISFVLKLSRYFKLWRDLNVMMQNNV